MFLIANTTAVSVAQWFALVVPSVFLSFLAYVVGCVCAPQCLFFWRFTVVPLFCWPRFRMNQSRVDLNGEETLKSVRACATCFARDGGSGGGGGAKKKKSPFK